jgi:hypothetical protein
MKNSPAQNMEVEVENGLAGPGTCVDDDPISSSLESALAGHARCYAKHPAQEGFILCAGIVERCQVLARNYQDMNRGLGMSILDGYHVPLLVENFARYAALDNAAKDAVVHGVSH